MYHCLPLQETLQFVCHYVFWWDSKMFTEIWSGNKFSLNLRPFIDAFTALLLQFISNVICHLKEVYKQCVTVNCRHLLIVYFYQYFSIFIMALRIWLGVKHAQMSSRKLLLATSVWGFDSEMSSCRSRSNSQMSSDFFTNTWNPYDKL